MLTLRLMDSFCTPCYFTDALVKENEAFVVIPLTRSINPATRRYLDVESETKRVRYWILSLNVDIDHIICYELTREGLLKNH